MAVTNNIAGDRAVQILGDAGAELELGRALSAYADFEERTGRVDAASELIACQPDIERVYREAAEKAAEKAAQEPPAS